MYDSTAFLQSEMTYRADRIKAGTGGRKRRGSRVPRIRRTAEAVDRTR